MDQNISSKKSLAVGSFYKQGARTSPRKIKNKPLTPDQAYKKLQKMNPAGKRKAAKTLPPVKHQRVEEETSSEEEDVLPIDFTS